MKLIYPDGLADCDKLMRCETDRLLLSPVMIRRGECMGHKLRIAYSATLFEWTKWKLGWLR